MNTVRLWIFTGAVVAGLLCGHVSLRAQPASEPVPAGDESIQPGRDPLRAGGEPIATDDSNKPWVQGAPLEHRVAARELFLKGYELAKNSAYRSAAETFTAALAKWKHPSFYYNLGLAQLYLGQTVEALENLEHALQYGEAPLGADYFKEAQKRLEEVKRQLGRIRVICRTPGAEVTLNGATLFIGPGTHEGWTKAKIYELTAKRAGYQSEARRVTVAAGERLEVDLSLMTLTQATDSNRRWAVWKPWGVIAAGVMVASGGGVLHGFSSKNFTEYDEGFSALPCAQGTGCRHEDIPGSYREQLSRARWQQGLAVGSYVAGGGLIATGFVLLYLNQPRLAELRGDSPRARSIAVAPALSGNTVTIVASVAR